MQRNFAVALFIIVMLCGGCSSGTTKPGGKDTESASGKTFMDVNKQVPPRLEWNRDISSRSGGTFSFRVTSQGPFSVIVVTDKGYQAIQGNNRKAFDKEDVLLTVDSVEPSLDGKVTVPAGRSWFIVKNQTDKQVDMRLQCFAP
jgi:hypothetical protein